MGIEAQNTPATKLIWLIKTFGDSKDKTAVCKRFGVTKIQDTEHELAKCIDSNKELELDIDNHFNFALKNIESYSNCCLLSGQIHEIVNNTLNGFHLLVAANNSNTSSVTKPYDAHDLATSQSVECTGDTHSGVAHPVHVDMPT